MSEHPTPANVLSRTFPVEEAGTACDCLATFSGLSKGRIKDCMIKGGVWWSRPGRATTRLRRATTAVHPGEHLELNYDSALLALIPTQPELIYASRHYSVWNKPVGVLAQGTRFADHCCLPRLAQAILGSSKELHAVHRLDREARGLMLLAHDGKAAAKLGELFRHDSVSKCYTVIVKGIPAWETLTLTTPLDGKACTSHFTRNAIDEITRTALLTATIETGRKHQIRRHLAGLGLPVLGDSRYGQGRELKLLAQSLAFTCPFTNKAMHWELPSLSLPNALPAG